MSPYVFVVNNPLSYIDEDGREPTRSQAGTLEQAVAQWKNNKITNIWKLKEFVSNSNNIRYIYTKDVGWIDLQHYFGVQCFSKPLMDLLEPASGNHFLLNEGITIFGKTFKLGNGAENSYFSYEDLPTNKFASTLEYSEKMKYYFNEANTIDVFEKHLQSANPLAPEDAPNWKGIPYADDRKVLPRATILGSLLGIPTGSSYTESSNPNSLENKKLLESGKYIPQNHSDKPFDLKDFPAAPTSIEKGDKR
ncbi:MAG: hypothetical protein U0V72_13920 [Cytophagales bacterium]